MKSFLVLVSFLGVAYAGVGTLSPQEEADALELFSKICNGGGYGGGYGGDELNIGGTVVYCKRAKGDLTENLHHNVNVHTPNQPQVQKVFVQPPPVHYQHRVYVKGSGGQAQQTKVYVLPQTATHELTAEYKGQYVTPVKPIVYFLRGGSSSAAQTSYGPPSTPQTNYGAPPSQPRDSYGAPPKINTY